VGQKGERKYGKSTQQGAVVKRVAEGARKYGESTQQGEAVKRSREAYRKKCSGSITHRSVQNYGRSAVHKTAEVHRIIEVQRYSVQKYNKTTHDTQKYSRKKCINAQECSRSTAEVLKK
jgi:hypothetical protein